MGVSKPQAYCQELQLATGRAKLSGSYGPCAVSSRNEHRTGKRTHPQEPGHHCARPPTGTRNLMHLVCRHENIF